jgi:hypothetical protein
VVAGPRLENARHRLLARAVTLGHRLTDDPGLLVMAGGRVLRAEVSGSWWRIRLPPGVESVRLVSRTWVPANTRADATDTRALGVAISGLRLDRATVRLDDARLSSGWHAAEQADSGGWRWTDGDAGLALAGVREVEFELVMTGTYWSDPQGEWRSADHS